MEIAKIAALAPIKTADTIKAKQGDGKSEGQTFQQALEKAASSGDNQKLRDACQQFESLFIYQLMERMRATVPQNDLWGDNTGVQIFQGMLDEEYSKNMSKAGGIGLGQMLYDQLKPNDKLK